MLRNFFRIIIVTVLLSIPVLIQTASAQIPDPNNGGNGPPVGAPIDGGATLLLAAGAVLGCKKINDARKKKTS
ncbi:MAG: hypothetical protein WCM76_07870 [Bacteroidota bacterium]